MTWQLGAFAILVLGLASGFAWYERTRPDARIVALVGVLAAFAALGRIAFAALPNVKPTTDIVLMSGYALGGAPGFVVGALAGLTSNFFFGQGPWTPWQMAAWGATGAFGAGLAIVTRGRLGRWPLALACAVIGYAFAAFQDVGDWVNYSDHSIGALGVYVGKGTGFDLVHAGGCLVFALAFGPALTRSIRRFAARLQVTWRTLDAVVLPATLVCVLLAHVSGLSRVAPASAASTPTGYLLGAQNGDGGFGPAPGSASSTLFSGWAALGLAAEGENPREVRRGALSLIDYIRTNVGSLSSDPGSLERTILVVRAAGLSATAFGGQDLVAALERDVHRDGSVARQVNLTSFAVLALRAAGVMPPSRTVSWLIAQRDQDGGFNFATAGATSDVDDTSAALEALAGVSGDAARAARTRAVTFIRAHQNRDGGFPSQAGGPSNAQSTAWAVQGLLAARVAPASLHRAGAVAPLRYLRSLVGPDGHVRYSSASDQTPVWVTAQAAMALALKPLPLAPVPSRSATRRHRARAARAGAASSRAPAGRQRAASARRAAEVRGRRAIDTSATSRQALSRFAVDAGLVAAVMLAPVGLG